MKEDAMIGVRASIERATRKIISLDHEAICRAKREGGLHVIGRGIVNGEEVPIRLRYPEKDAIND